MKGKGSVTRNENQGQRFRVKGDVSTFHDQSNPQIIPSRSIISPQNVNMADCLEIILRNILFNTVPRFDNIFEDFC